MYEEYTDQVGRIIVSLEDLIQDLLNIDEDDPEAAHDVNEELTQALIHVEHAEKKMEQATANQKETS